MCSILFTTRKISNLEKVNKFLKPRGPDVTKLVENEHGSFLHNLLSITGIVTPQPIEDDGIILLFNGEIYDYDKSSYQCDTYSIIPLYKKYGNDFPKYLDGEFAIVLLDTKNGKLIYTTDTFGTKPLFIGYDKFSSAFDIGISTYATPLKELGYDTVEKIKANTTVIWQNGERIEQTVHEFELNQFKTNYDDWNLAFSESVRKRTDGVRENIFIGLSSGYDSGVLCKELINKNIKFKAYSVTGSENIDILAERYRLFVSPNELKVLTITPKDWNVAHNYLVENTEEWKYTVKSDRSEYNEFYLSLWDDNGSNNLSHVCSLAKRDNKKIFLETTGCDEIISDYGFAGISKYKHSNFGGLFPEDLKTIYPWASFYGSTMESYLMKAEYVGGSYGIETRYPFLDKKVVQEFLWLDYKLKNSVYKSVLDNYLKTNNFPYSPNQKIGF